MKRKAIFQKKFLLFLAGMIAVFCFLVLSVYVPTEMMIRKLKRTHSVKQNEIRQLEDLIGGGQSMEQGIQKLEITSHEIDSLLPRREESALKQITDILRGGGLEIISMKSLPRTPLLSETQDPVMIGPEAVDQISVSIELRGTYKDMVNSLDSLKKELKAFVTFEQIDLAKTGGQNERLYARLELMMYLLAAGK